MVSPRIGRLKASLFEKYGIDFNISYSTEGNIPAITFAPVNLSEFKGLKATIKLEWRRIEGELSLGDFNGELLRELERREFYRNELYRTYISLIKKEDASVQLIINGVTFGPEEIDTLPSQWTRFAVKLVKKYVVFDKNNMDEVDKVVEAWSSRIVGLLASILPFEPLDYPAQSEGEGLPEGAQIRVSVNKYERNRLNRQACIDYHGTKCLICGFDHEKTYGEIGKDFIQVHHLTPVSKLGKDYVINPIQDLIPVCPNCHSMLHRKDPPLAPEALKRLIQNG